MFPEGNHKVLKVRITHPLEHKLSVIRTLFYRAETVVTDPVDQVSELDHVKSALRNCCYEDWSFKRACTKKQQKETTQTESPKTTTNKTFVVTPFVQGVSEPIRRLFNSYGVSVSLKPHQTLHQLLVSAKDKAKIEDQTGAVYRIPCAGCDKVYIGETKRLIGERLKEHTAKVANNLSVIAEHYQKVLCREDKLIPCKVREAISKKKETSPTLNRDGGA